MDVSDYAVRELSPMVVQLWSEGESMDGTYSEMNATQIQEVQRTPICSQAVPLCDLELSSQDSSLCDTPSKSTTISTLKIRKEERL